MIHDLSGKEKSALLGAAEIALGMMGEGEESRGWQRPEDRPLSAEETTGFAVGDPFGEYGLPETYKRHKNAPGFRIKRPSQPKKKGLPVPEGVKFLYFGRPELGSREQQGVVTVAWKEVAPGLLHMAFAFCSPGDKWCKITGRDMAITRLSLRPLVIPFLYSPKRTVHEVVRAVLTHDFMRLAAMAPGMTMFGMVPSWTKALAKRLMGGTERERQAAKIWQKIVNQELCKIVPLVLGGVYIAPPTRDLPFNIMSRMMADIAALDGR